MVDTLDAMTSDRPYRQALSYERAREELRRYAGVQFDPAIVEAFCSIPAGLWKEERRKIHEAIAAKARARIGLMAGS